MTIESHTSMPPMQPDEKRAVGIVAWIGMLRMFGLFAMLPVLALYAATLDGATPMLVGIAVGGYGLTQASLQMPLGALSDRVGRVPVIIAGFAVFAVGSIVAALSDTIWMMIVGRLLQGAGAVSATLTALVSDATRKEFRTRSMAIYGVGVGLAFMLALAIGPLIAAHFGDPAVFWLAAVLAVVAALSLRGLPEGIKPPVAHDWKLRPAFRPELLRLDFYVFLLHAILTASFVALPFLLAHRLAMPVTSHWHVYVGALVVSLLGTVPLIMSDERQGKARTVGIAVGLMLVGELLLAFASFGVMPVFIALVAFFAGFNFLEAGLPARLSVLADGDARGASLGVFSSAQFFGAFVGGLIGGRFLTGGNPTDVFFVCALLAAIWLASSSLFRR